MNKTSKPIITPCKTGESWTKVSFKPDLAKFNMSHLEEDVVALMKKRVVDLAGCLGETLKVELNGQQVPVNSFLDYVNLYVQPADSTQPSMPRFIFRSSFEHRMLLQLVHILYLYIYTHKLGGFSWAIHKPPI